MHKTIHKSRDSSVGMALGYGVDDRGSRVRFPAGSGNFSLLHRVQNGSGAHPTSYPMGTRGSFPGGKAAGAWSWPLHLVPNEWSYTSTPQYTSMAWCSVKAQGQLTLPFTNVSYCYSFKHSHLIPNEIFIVDYGNFPYRVTCFYIHVSWSRTEV
jgi:hypothetical protein